MAIDSAGRLYDANIDANRVAIFADGAIGAAAPVATIAGAATGLDAPIGLTLDGAGRLYVANRAAHSVLVFAVGSAGSVAPAMSIAGARTGLNDPVGIALQ